MKSTHFNDKVCWITGASSGIGAALAAAVASVLAAGAAASLDSDEVELPPQAARLMASPATAKTLTNLRTFMSFPLSAGPRPV